MPGLTTLVLCFEDACPEEKLPEAMENVHHLLATVTEAVDKGELDPDLAFYHPNSNIITRSLGDNPAKAQPDYVSRKLSQGDLILLCSDGLCGLCKDEEILDVLTAEEEGGSIEHCKNTLIEAALTAGGHDNVTVALFQCLSLKEQELTQTLVGSPKKKKCKFHLFHRKARD